MTVEAPAASARLATAGWCGLAQATLDVRTPDIPDHDSETPLFRHVKRPEWGVAIMAYEREGARAFQFEDGNLRKIRKGYYKLMEEADDLGERAAHIRKNLVRVVQADEGDADHTVVDAVAPFSEQVELFTRLYPKGFKDPEWIEDHRTTDGAALKRHRTPISEEAREALSAARCAEAIEGKEHQEFAEVVADILARTDLVPISHAKALRGLEPEEKARYVESVADLLHGGRPYGERFKDYLTTLKAILGERPSWRIATALSGLVHPQNHVVVRRSAFLRQAGSIAPTARYSRRATVASYKNYRRVGMGVRERLAALGHDPRDLLDVYDFVWTTLRTSALDHLGTDRD